VSDSRERRWETRAAELKAADDWVGLCREFDAVDPAALARSSTAAYAYGEALYRLGRPRDLASFADVFEAASRSNADAAGTRRALNMGGVAAFELGQMDQARRRLEAVLEMAYAETDHEMLAPAANNLGAIADLEGRTDEALSYYRLALPLYEQAGKPHGLAQTYHNLGISYRALRQIEEALRSHEKTLEIAGGIGYRPLVALSLSARAECEVDRGNTDLALELSERAIGIARESQDPVSEGEALRVRGVVHGRGGRGPQALRDFEAAERMALETDNRLLRAEILRDRGYYLTAEGCVEEARPLLAEAAHELRSLGAEAKAVEIESRIT
jgi:tetratricopeptide (TPR) repeat protein